MRRCGEGEGTPGAGSHGAQPVEGSGLARAGAPLLHRLGLSALPAAAEVKASLHSLPGACPPLRLCGSPCPPPLSPSRPNLAFFNPSLSLSARRSPVEVSGSPRVPGVSVALIVSAASLPSPGLRARLPLPSCVSASAGPGISPTPHPPPSLSLRLSRSVSLVVPAPLELLSEALRLPVSPGLVQLWRRAPRQIPFPCQVTMKTLATRKLLAFPAGVGVLPPQSPTPSVPW